MDFNTILQAAGTQGIWAVLFVALFVWTIKRYESREASYQAVIKDTTTALTKYAASYESLCSDVSEIKADVEQLKNQ